MKIGCSLLWGDDLERFRRSVRLADKLGYDIISLGDSAVAWQDLYVALSIVAQETKGVTLGPMVTTPFFRHPVINAGAMSSLHILTGGRVFFGLGRGGIQVVDIGRKRATQAEMRDYILAMRGLFNGEPITWEGFPVRQMRHARKVPIYYSALGPKALQMCGELADGLILNTGSSLEEIDRKLGLVRAAARAAGRDPAEIDIWITNRCAIRETRQAAVEEIKPVIARMAGYVAMTEGGLRDANVPDELMDTFRELGRRFDPNEIGGAGGSNARLIDELGLTEYLARTMAIVGTPDDFRTFADALEARGVSHFLCALTQHADPETMLQRVSDAIPH